MDIFLYLVFDKNPLADECFRAPEGMILFNHSAHSIWQSM